MGRASAPPSGLVGDPRLALISQATEAAAQRGKDAKASKAFSEIVPAFVSLDIKALCDEISTEGLPSKSVKFMEFKALVEKFIFTVRASSEGARTDFKKESERCDERFLETQGNSGAPRPKDPRAPSTRP